MVFGTRGNQQALSHLERIFHDLESQTFQDFQVKVVVDRTFKDQEEWNTWYAPLQATSSLCSVRAGQNSRVQFFTNLNSDFLPPCA